MDSIEYDINDIYSKFIELNNKINNNTSIQILEEALINIEKYDNKINNIKKIINNIDNIKSQIKLSYVKKIKNLSNLPINNKIETDYKIEIVNLTNDKKYKNKKYCNTPAVIISKEQINDIINCPLYMIKETNEFCIKINNKLIRGNIGNVVNKNDKKIKKCNRLYCNNTFFNKKECKFYHENIDIRNFPTYSWKPILKNKLGGIKIKNKKIEVNNYDLENTRFIGSLDSLNEDIVLSSYYEKKLRNKQLMHDLLLYQILDNYLE